jgi:hypothetical protein
MANLSVKTGVISRSMLVGNAPYSPYFFTVYKAFNNFGYTGTTSVDSTGNVYLPGSINNGTRQIGFLGKIDNAGVSTFQKTLTNSAGGCLFYSSCLDTAQTTVYAAMTSSAIGIASYSSSGTVQWQYFYRSSTASNNNGSTWGIAKDSSDNVYATGYGDGNAWNRLWLIKTNSSGTFQWGFEAGSVGSFGESVAVDSSNNVYVCGLTDPGTEGAFLAKTNSSGSLTWKKCLFVSTSNYIWWQNVSVNNSNSTVAVVGYNSSPSETVIAQYDLNGNLNWQRSTNASGDAYQAIAHDSSNNIYVTLQVSNGINIIKFDSSGTVLWQRRITNTQNVKMDNSNIEVVGSLMYISCIMRNGSAKQGLVYGNLPTDGTGVGSTFTIDSDYTFNYSTPTMTINTSTYTNRNTTSSTSNPSFTRTTTTYTEANGTIPFARS